MSSVEMFCDLATPFMGVDPFSTNVIGVHAAAILAGLRAPGAGDLWAAVVDDGEVVGVAMHTPPQPLFMSRTSALAASQLAEAIFDKEHPVAGVNGERASVTAFSERWSELSGDVSSVEVAMRMYRLGELRVPVGVSGRARPAGNDDIEVVTDWFAAFHAEAHRRPSTEDVRVVAEGRLTSGQLRVWVDDGKAVSLAAHSAPAQGVARIGPVYTPPRCRRHGYGAAVTANATRTALDGGATHVALYTDLANPTSNSIYQGIGYVGDHDAEERRFGRP